MEKPLTANQEKILNVLKSDFPDGAFADEIAIKLPDTGIASIRATLTSLANRNLLAKEKADYEGKMKTHYTLV